jgi:hypothetical protein
MPDASVTSSGDVPDFLKPFVTNLLTKATTAAGTPYAGLNSYYTATGGATPFAQINPLLKQAGTDAAALGTAPELDSATDMATSAGIGSLNAGNNYMNAASNPDAIKSLMNPYLSNVVERQKQGAISDYSRSIPGMGAKAAMAGGLGGSRSAILQAEGRRNLGNKLDDITATGYSNAYDKGQDILKSGTTFGLQGYGQGINAANALNTTGNSRFNQQQGAINTRNTIGNDIYSKESDVAKQRYADYQAMMNDPTKKADFLKGIVSGIPVSNSTSPVSSNTAADLFKLIAGILNPP